MKYAASSSFRYIVHSMLKQVTCLDLQDLFILHGNNNLTSPATEIKHRDT